MCARLCVLSVLLLAAPIAAQEDEEDNQKSQLLLYKKMDPMEGFAVGVPINVTLSVFNKGVCQLSAIKAPLHGSRVSSASFAIRPRQRL